MRDDNLVEKLLYGTAVWMAKTSYSVEEPTKDSPPSMETLRIVLTSGSDVLRKINLKDEMSFPFQDKRPTLCDESFFRALYVS